MEDAVDNTVEVPVPRSVAIGVASTTLGVEGTAVGATNSAMLAGITPLSHSSCSGVNGGVLTPLVEPNVVVVLTVAAAKAVERSSQCWLTAGSGWLSVGRVAISE